MEEKSELLKPESILSDLMSKAGASKILVDYLMGHKLNYDTAYFGGEKGLRESYIKYAELVLEPKRVKPTEEIENILREEIKSLEQRVREQNELIQVMKRDKVDLEEEVDKIREQIKELKKEIMTMRERPKN